MARIIYGVMGDSGGHINRSLAVAAEMKGHDFLFVGGGKVAEAREHGHGYAPLPMISTVLENNRVLFSQTIGHFFQIITGYGRIIDELCRIIESFQPDLAVTDYEFFLPRAARRSGLPCVSLDHQHILTHCRYSVPRGQAANRLLTMASVRHLFSAADTYVVSSFFPLPPKCGAVEVVPPILHHDILNQNPVEGDHVVAYMRSGVDRDLMGGLRSLGRECRIYGTGEVGSEGNLKFMPASRVNFLKDLSSCGYVICNGGHTLISEALQLGKPVLAFPTAFFYEQYFNAVHLRQLGYGDFAVNTSTSERTIATFEKGLETYRANLEGLDMFGNALAAEKMLARVGA